MCVLCVLEAVKYSICFLDCESAQSVFYAVRMRYRLEECSVCAVGSKNVLRVFSVIRMFYVCSV